MMINDGLGCSFETNLESVRSQIRSFEGSSNNIHEDDKFVKKLDFELPPRIDFR